MVVESDDVGLKIANALGINLPNIRRVDLKLEAGNIVEVNVAYYPTKEAMDTLLLEMKSYCLVEKKEDLEVVIQGQDIIGAQKSPVNPPARPKGDNPVG